MFVGQVQQPEGEKPKSGRKKKQTATSTTTRGK